MLAPRANSSLSKQLPTLQLSNERVDDLNDNNKQVVYSKNLHKQVIDEEEEDRIREKINRFIYQLKEININNLGTLNLDGNIEIQSKYEREIYNDIFKSKNLKLLLSSKQISKQNKSPDKNNQGIKRILFSRSSLKIKKSW